jgi:hypothetical protein
MSRPWLPTNWRFAPPDEDRLMNADWMQNLIAIAVVAVVVALFVRGRLRMRDEEGGCGSGSCGSCGSASQGCSKKTG